MSEKKPRTIKLLCPSLSKGVQMVAREDQKIDLGSIARAFGLDPSSLKLNGHFISRGFDLISSSVTWRSLLSFFSAKGLSTGKHDLDARLVTGKLCKLGNKRGHESQDAGNGICKVIGGENECIGRERQLEAVNFNKNKKLRESNSGEILNGLGFKRKQLLEDVDLFKKLKINDDESGMSYQLYTDNQDKENELSSNIGHSPFTCRYISKNLKRMREDEAFVAVHCKRIR